MASLPDGREVVATPADAARLKRPPLLVIDMIEEFFDNCGLGDGPLAWERIGDGQSNVTFLITRGHERFVLRRGPRPPLPRSTHDMVREARVQQLLGEQGIPVPEILAVCDDESLLGVPFYVMSYLNGFIITDSVPAQLDTLAGRRSASEAVIDALATLHSLDVESTSLASLGRPDGYLKRQVDRFAALWEVNTTRGLPEVELLARWLDANLPVSQAVTVIHGDYRPGNIMFAPDSSARVLAVLDWEMATIGDPLADLGYLTAMYAEAGSPVTPMELTPVTRQPGFLSRAQLIERYRVRMALDLDALSWYQTLALWKAAVFCEAIYTRWLKGERPDDTTFGPTLERGIPQLLELARASARI
jgi:aminoglycoside phosphotransferase (APT) family kinase protein